MLDPDTIADGTDTLGVGTGDAPPGTYVLVFGVDPGATIDVGALGTAEFPSGAYAYVGSAFGPSGLGRVDRHRRVAAGSHDVRHWHVDYLGGHAAASLDAVVAAPDADIECRLAAALRDGVAGADSDGDAPLPGFGASDCDCPAHLVAGANAGHLRGVAVDAVKNAAPRRR
nr:GIY-YIG nuclease family protein [Halobellus salinus]